MHVTYACQACHAAVRHDFDQTTTAFTCPHCQQQLSVPAGAVANGRITRCLVCPSRDLFVRKDFPQRVGVWLVAIGIIGSSIAWYYWSLAWTFGILFATAAIDVVLYLLVGSALMCYRCGAHYRGVAEMETHGQFNLETHEKYRQLAARTRTSPSLEGQRGAEAPRG
jgi:DNA-directed RNA polymerase subunit RPC12/RpoP